MKRMEIARLVRRWMACLSGAWLIAARASAAFGADWSVHFNGTNQYATFGTATATLGATNFTIECWFKRTAAGTTTSTGTGGITAVPLVAKGRGEADGDSRDCNYFFGITSGGVLGADYEEGAGQASPGLNHPVSGSTTIANNQWYHGAVTFDGTTMRLYLNGQLDGTLNVGTNRLPRHDSIQHASLASALTSAGSAAGYFAGRLDEVRIWNRARTQAEIASTMRAKVPSAAGLLARWSLDEGTGTNIASTAGTTVNGTLMNTPTWNIDTPFSVVPAGSVWKYLDNGSDQGTAWRAPAFDDSAWAGGPAELGYGDNDEATVVGYGPDPNNKYITTYFRHAFNITDAAKYSGLDFSLVRDDGAVVYLNGAEVWRSNMPEGPILYNTVAASPEVSGADEAKWFSTNLPALALLEGANVVAVEIHQQRASSSDISFNLKLAASRLDEANEPPTISLTTPAAGALLAAGVETTLSATAADNDGAIAKVEFFVNGGKAGEDTESPYTCGWTPVTPGRVTLTAKATDDQGAATTSAGVEITVYEDGTGALQFDGVNDYVTFGQALSLGASNFTIECWMRRLGPGVTANTGSGGVLAVPLVTKGRGEAENSNVDCNYFFGLLPSGALAADFEQFHAEGGGAAGQNYPVTGVSTAPGDGQWHHVAATYDGTTWRLYVDGALDRELNIGSHTPRFDSIQHAALGTAMNSSGVREGAFEGLLDEVRIWNYARNEAQIAACRDKAIAAANGLLGRWSLNEGAGAVAANSVAGQPDGTLVNGPVWCLGRSLEGSGSVAPVVSLTTPADGSTVFAGENLTLSAEAFDDDGSVISVVFLAGETELGSDATAPYSYVWTAVPEGAHALRAVATDNDGLAATSVIVNVSAIVRNDPPVLSGLAPADGAGVAGDAAILRATATDPEGQPITVRFYGRVRTQQPPAADFTIVALPDTQYYSKNYPHIFTAQTDWIVAQRAARNIAYVAHLGDITEDATDAAAQWNNASNALARLENPATTGLPHGIPYGVVPGNHDHISGIAYFEQYFGVSRFAGRSYYGGHFGADNRNHYDLISAGGMDFLFVYVDFNYGGIPNYAELNAWANSVIQAHPNRRAVVVSHAIIDAAGNFNADNGQALFNAVKGNTNLFLMLCGHYVGERQRTETVNGRRMDILLSDYQGYANGGNGFLRLYEFSPSNNVIRVKTYSPTLDQYETDSASQFEIPYTMAAPADPTPFTLLGETNGMVSGDAYAVAWSGLTQGTQYEWYVEAHDGVHTVTSPVLAFQTAAPPPPPEPVVRVFNPYSNVTWSAVNAYKANLHTHTSNSDGSQTPAARIDEYDTRGYDVLALTDHNFVTYPWTAYGRDPSALGMVAIQGNELSSGHHTLSLFCGYASTSADQTTLLTGVANAGGLSVFAHPGRYTYEASWYANHYRAHPTCIGQEIYNQGDRYPADRAKWDQVLTILMPGRPVWGFSNDDAHTVDQIGRNRTYILADALTEANVRAALERGVFFATYSTSSNHVPPAITNVTVDEIAGTITVGGMGYTQVVWISQGSVVGTNETLNLVGTLGVAKYVRVELRGTQGVTLSNPFGLRPVGNQAPTVDAGPDRTVTLPNAVTLTGSATDDGLPNPPGTLTIAWNKVSGPGTVTFANAAAAQTTATFSQAGTYVLRLTANDGALSAYDDVTVTVNAAAQSGISVGPSGSGTLTFDSLPPAGEWATAAIGSGKDGFTTAAGLDAGVQGLNQSAVVETLIGDTSASPAKRNRAVWTSGGGKFIQLSSTSVGAVLLKATLVNGSGEAISSLRVAYDYTVSGTQPEEVPGLRVFYSLTGAPGSWVLIPEFSGLLTGQALDTTLTFGAPWQPGAQMFLMWADDNAAADDERKYQLDNFSATPAGTPLSVALSAPADGATFARNENVVLAATVAGGTAPYTVRFFAAVDGGAPAQVGTDVSAAPYQINLGQLAPGSYVFHAEATDAAGGATVSATSAATVANLLAPVTNTLLAAGSVWKYLDNGSDQGTAWRAPAFDDSGWAQGPAPLGYGDPWIVTTVYSPPQPNRYITTYFRKTIQIERPQLFSEVKLRCMRDDGVVVYVNGVEVWRSNMPEGEINYLTFSSTIVDGANETTWFEGAVPPGLLVPGANVIAVELHQRDGNSSDLTFDFQLLATMPGGAPNEPPVVNAGPDLNVVLPAAATLNGVATDDGLPVPPGALTVTWRKVSGPGTVTIADPASATTTATFSQPGEYVLRLEASDGAAETADECLVTVQAAPAPSLAVLQPAAKKVVVPNETESLTLSGTASAAEGEIRLVNSLGGEAVRPANSVWAFADVPLAVGVNRLTISASNAVGTVAERITVIRQAAPAADTLRMAVFSDPHYFAPQLLIENGPAFQMYLAQDRKLIAESAAIAEEAVDQIIAQNADVVLVPGDLTKDGERASHEAMAAELGRLAAAGAQVLVIPGNHDVNNPHAVAYDGATTIPVSNVSPEEFRAIYAPFGYNQAVASDSNSLAYAVDPLPNLRILCMDACQYGQSQNHTAGSFDAQRLAWITNQIAAARAEGRMVLGMMHHGLLEHFQGQKSVFSEYVVDDWQNVAALFAAHGMRAVFTGHFHANDIVKGTFGGKDIYDIETGSLVTWPCPYRVMELDADGNLIIATRHVEEIAYDLGDAPDFETYAYDYLESGLLTLSSHMLQAPPYSLPPATADFLAPAFTEAMLSHYAGDEAGLAGATPATQAIVMNLLNSGDPLQVQLGQALHAILTDPPPADNDVSLALVRPPFVLIETPADGLEVGATETEAQVSVYAAGVVGELTYANATMGVTVRSAATTVILPLRPGDNELTVTGTNAMGETAYDAILVHRIGGPVPDVKANDSDAPITIHPEDVLSVTLSLGTAGYAGVHADWWILAHHADSGQWYQYVAPFTTTSWRPWTGGTSLQAPLFDFTGHEAVRMSDLPAGQWTFYFGVDAPQNGVMDMNMLFYDGVAVSVTPQDQ